MRERHTSSLASSKDSSQDFSQRARLRDRCMPCHGAATQGSARPLGESVGVSAERRGAALHAKSGRAAPRTAPIVSGVGRNSNPESVSALPLKFEAELEWEWASVRASSSTHQSSSTAPRVRQLAGVCWSLARRKGSTAALERVDLTGGLLRPKHLHVD
eukprot:1761855-Rhodomonas_salina.1